MGVTCSKQLLKTSASEDSECWTSISFVSWQAPLFFQCDLHNAGFAGCACSGMNAIFVRHREPTKGIHYDVIITNNTPAV